MKKFLKVILLVMLFFAVCIVGTVFLSNAFGSVQAPVLKSAINGYEGVVISWEPTESAEKYAVYRKMGDETEWSRITTVTGDSYTDTTAQSGKTCAYNVRACIGKRMSAQGDKYLLVLCLSTPKITKVSNGTDSITIKWSGVSGAKEYQVYRRRGGENAWTKMTTVTSDKATLYIDKNVVNGKSYAYRVRAVNDTVRSGYDLKGTAYKFVSAPKLENAVLTSNGVKLTWKKGDSVSSYYVYRKAQDAKKWSRLAQISASKVSYTDTKAKSGVTYTYMLKQAIGKYVSSYYDELTIKYIAAVKNIKAVNSPNGVTLTWSKVSGCKSYLIYRKVSGTKNWIKTATVSGEKSTSYIDKKAVYGKYIYYNIRAYESSNCCSVFGSYTSVMAINPDKPAIALTYDDGPYRPVTNHILDVLQANKARATFFVVGSRIDEFSDCIKREAATGCEIGNHTYGHTTLTKLSCDEISNEFKKTSDLIEKLTGKPTTLVRAPGGNVNDEVLSYVKYPLINWSVDTRDWESRDCDTVVENIKKDVFDGSIVLMHDLYISSGDATEIIVPWLIEQGYQLVTVSELMQVKGITLKNGTSYRTALK